MKPRFWLLVAVAMFIIASARFYSVADSLGASVFGMVGLVFAVRLLVDIRRAKKESGG